MSKNIKQAVKIMKEGGIIAYPTEGVFGLGCDPFNQTAVMRLLKIKKRDVAKGLILIAASWNQVTDLIKLNNLKLPKSDPKNPTTWVLPSTKKAPIWVRGDFKSIAIRITTHSIAKKLCQKFVGPIISTSANLSDQMPSKNIKQVKKQFADTIDFILEGKVGDLNKPSKICDIKTKNLIRT